MRTGGWEELAAATSVSRTQDGVRPQEERRSEHDRRGRRSLLWTMVTVTRTSTWGEEEEAEEEERRSVGLGGRVDCDGGRTTAKRTAYRSSELERRRR